MMETTSLRTALAALGAFAAIAVASSAQAQWSYVQRWNFQRDSHTSRVLSCANPAPLPLVAWDDWVADENAVIRVVTWWGVLTNADAQENQFNFRIAFASHDEANCLPGAIIYQRCCKPQRAYVGQDCDGLSVYRFWCVLPGPPFVQTADEHYWVSIAEEEQSSPTQGEDFRWSGHRTPKNCDAAQLQPGGTFIQPLVSACDRQTNDLAFDLHGRAIAGHTEPFADVGVIELRAMGAGDASVIEVLHIAPNEDGHWIAFSNVPDGQYNATLRVPGAVAVQASVTLVDGAVANVDFPALPLGDLNGDQNIGAIDLLTLLVNWGDYRP